MRKGDLARGYEGWLARLLASVKIPHTNEHAWRVRWETGPLAGREAVVSDPGLRRVG